MREIVRKYAVRFNTWLTSHWRMVMWCMLMVMIMQQCTISRLRWEVTQMTHGIARQQQPQTPAAEPLDTASAPSATAQQDSTSVAAEASPAADDGTPSAGIWIACLAALAALGAAVGAIYMRRNGIYPIGITLRGKLKSDMTYHIKVSNNSRKPVDVAEPLVVFIMGGATRKFRANVGQLPMTLSPKTSFEADINLSGLISANLELASAKAIGMSISTNGKRHSTLPTPVRIKTA